MAELIVVIPYCQEWANIAFTCRSVYEELQDFDVEVCVGDNWCDEVSKQGQKPDRGHDHYNDKGEFCVSHLMSMAEQTPWLRYFKWDEGLSHWQVKNHIIKNTDSRYILFCDAHCVPGRGSLSRAFAYYKQHEEELDGTLSVPLTYHLLESKKLIYRLVYDKRMGKCEYSFMSLPEIDKQVFQVPTMSSCGMILSRKISDLLLSFPQQFSYSGGEHYLFQSLAVLGKKMWIFNGSPLHHHGNDRGYHWDYNGYHINRAMSWYCMGDDWLNKYMECVKGPNKEAIRQWAKELAKEHRAHIDKNKTMTIEDWYEKNWQDKLFI